ncbi:MAG: hypothetical protein AAFO74_06035 [Pseudomonadota bacterium]
MSAIDWVIILLPAVLAAWALLFGGIKIFIKRIGNTDMAIGLFGVVLCWAAAASYAFFLTEPAKQMMSDQTALLVLIGAGNLLLAIWSYLRPNKN